MFILQKLEFFIVIIIGFLFLYKPFIIWFIGFRNQLRGVKTETTPLTILYTRGVALIVIIVGILSIFFEY
jgi:hypothetical protein